MKKKRTSTFSINVTDDLRRFIESTAARWTIEHGRRHTMTDVIDAALELLRKKEKHKGD